MRRERKHIVKEKKRKKKKELHAPLNYTHATPPIMSCQNKFNVIQKSNALTLEESIGVARA